jgi:hypothetical protein
MTRGGGFTRPGRSSRLAQLDQLFREYDQASHLARPLTRTAVGGGPMSYSRWSTGPSRSADLWFCSKPMRDTRSRFGTVT